MDNIPVLISGMIVGTIIFQTAIVAPSVFTSLSGPDSSTFLRKVFPRFFILLAVLGGTANVAAIIVGQAVLIAISGATVALAAIAYVLIPATNHSRDEGREKTFKRLHLASVVLTLGILAANLASLAV
jgi:hypothetical protein